MVFSRERLGRRQRFDVGAAHDLRFFSEYPSQAVVSSRDPANDLVVGVLEKSLYCLITGVVAGGQGLCPWSTIRNLAVRDAVHHRHVRRRRLREILDRRLTPIAVVGADFSGRFSTIDGYAGGADEPASLVV